MSSFASATLPRSPPESTRAGLNTSSPRMPNRATHGAHVRFRRFRFAQDILKRRPFGIQCALVGLIEPADARSGIESNGAIGRFAQNRILIFELPFLRRFRRNRAHQRGLSASVRADERSPAAGWQSKAHVFQKRLIARAQRQISHLQNCLRAHGIARAERHGNGDILARAGFYFHMIQPRFHLPARLVIFLRILAAVHLVQPRFAVAPTLRRLSPLTRTFAIVLNRCAQPRLFAAILIVFKLLKRAPPLQFRAVCRYNSRENQ